MTRAWAARTVLMGIAALMLPACKDADSPSILFLETFDGVFPGTRWSVPAATGTATAVKDVLNGSPDPGSLRMTATSTGSSITTETTTTFPTAALSFSVHMAADPAPPGGEGIGTIKILDGSAATVASASWSEPTGNLTLTIFGAALDVTIAAPAADLSFHRLKFTIAGNGSANWTLDNGTPLMTHGSSLAGPYTVELGASYPAGTAFAQFYFDNVNVTSP